MVSASAPLVSTSLNAVSTTSSRVSDRVRSPAVAVMAACSWHRGEGEVVPRQPVPPDLLVAGPPRDSRLVIGLPERLGGHVDAFRVWPQRGEVESVHLCR